MFFLSDENSSCAEGHLARLNIQQMTQAKAINKPQIITNHAQ